MPPERAPLLRQQDTCPKVNGWTCDACGETTYIVHVEEGVTPMFLACRAEGVEPDEARCKGTGRSLMYPPPPVPRFVIAAVRWEWYRPDDAEMRALEAGAFEHVRKGGALLRPLTNAGRVALGLEPVDA